MIKNIGFTENSTHTSSAPHRSFLNPPIQNLESKSLLLNGCLKVDKKYEITHVAEYWNKILIGHKKLFYLVRGELINNVRKGLAIIKLN